ncbi:hypothetical protein HU200_036128 [Digitaria exilis]|uniref:Peptidase A1 domain-containing protein n=1 Tax=Digitaria exilis TaxID=1010633 RepID=A0A835BGH0_9POAL|nr:hypothetical protein HU200_036128 [Digitaria exilis]
MRSPTYRPVAGSDKICTPEHGMEPAGVRCAFHVAGPGGLSVHGYVAREHIVHLETNRISPNFVLGCAHSTENFQSEGEYVGIATFSQAPTSLAMQLAARGLTRGTVIDLGTSVTVMAQLKEHEAERVEQRRYGLGVRVTKVVKGHLPSMSFHFADEEEATLIVSPEQLFLMIDDEHVGQMTCLAIVPGRRTVIGALQQLDTHFVFDLKDSKILFAPELCIKDTYPDV